jgi:hypothetical protein
MATLEQAKNVVVAAQIADSLKQQLIDLEKTLALFSQNPQQNPAPNMQAAVDLFGALRQKLDDLTAAQAQLVKAQNAVTDLTSQLGAANIKLASANAANADLAAKLSQVPAAGATSTTNPAIQKTNSGQVVVSAPVTAGIALGSLVIGAGLSWWAKGYWDKRSANKAIKAKELEEAAEEEAKKAKRLKK